MLRKGAAPIWLRLKVELSRSSFFDWPAFFAWALGLGFGVVLVFVGRVTASIGGSWFANALDAKLERIFPGAAIAFTTILESVDGVATPVLGRIFLGLNVVKVFSKTVLS